MSFTHYIATIHVQSVQGPYMSTKYSKFLELLQQGKHATRSAGWRSWRPAQKTPKSKKKNIYLYHSIYIILYIYMCVWLICGKYTVNNG